MAACSKSNCKKPVEPPGTLCKDHKRLKQQEDMRQAQQKKQMEDKRKAEEEERKRMAAAAVKKEKDAAAKAAKVLEIARTWNAQVKAVATQVNNLRHANPTRTNINAGTNAGLATIPGGTGNPLTFSLPSNTLGIVKADVYHHMTGFDNSDSGSFKFRVDGVLVHGH